MRGILRALAVAGVAVLLASVAASPSSAETLAPEDAAGGPSEISIPYQESKSIETTTPWRIVDCDTVRAHPLVQSCDAESIVLAADYDPDAGTAILPVTLRAGKRTMTVRYRITLEGPAAPTVAHLTDPRAVAAGALLRIPLSDLRIECVVCSDGGGVQVDGVDPAEAGSAWATGTHVVFRASRDYEGPAEVVLQVSDDHDAASKTAVTAFVYPSARELVALDVAVPVDGDGRAEVDLTALTFSRGEAEAIVVGCGAAVHGTVICDESGTARYRGRVVPDQFSFHVIADGEQAWGSVTLVAADQPAGVVPADRIASDEPVQMTILPPVPPADAASAAAGGIFSTLTAVMDRVGAR